MVICLSICYLCACSHSVPTADDARDVIIHDLISKMNDNDIRWKYTSFGLRPELTGSTNLSAIRLNAIGAPAIPSLINTLQDRGRFVAAHILLTDISDVDFVAGNKRWNFLRVHREANGTTAYDFTDSTLLRNKWLQWWNNGGKSWDPGDPAAEE